MKYFLLKLLAIVMLPAGGGWLLWLRSQDITFLVLPSVFQYQGALLLILASIVLVILTLRAERQHKHKTSMLQQYPAQPWMWRRDWVQRQAESSHRLQAWSTLFALAWTLLLVPVVIAAIPTFRHDLLFMVVFAYGFPAVGFGMLLCQAIKWLRVWREGKIKLRFSQLPARLGKRFNCEIVVPLQARTLRYEAELLCLHEHVETSRIDNEHHTSWVRDELWHEVIVPQPSLRGGSTHLAMRFQLPVDQPASSFEQEQGKRWYVVIRAISKSGRTRFRREYEIPVAPAQEEPNTSTISGPATFELPDMDQGQVLHKPAVDSNEDSQADTRQHQQVADDPGKLRHHLASLGVNFSDNGIDYDESVWQQTGIHESGTVMTLVPLILTIVFAVVFYLKVIVDGDLFALPTGLGVLIGLVMLGIVSFLRYHRFTIMFTPEGIVRHSRLFSWQWRKVFPWEKVRKVTTTLSSSLNTGQRRVHYDKVVVYGDTYKQSMAVSPGFREELNATMLRDLLRDLVSKHSQS